MSRDSFEEHKTNIGKLTNYSFKRNKEISRNIKQYTSYHKSLQTNHFPSLSRPNPTRTLFNSRHKFSNFDKSQIQSVLKKCYELSRNGKTEPKERLKYMEKIVEDFEARFIMNPQAVNDILQLKAKNKLQDDLTNLQEKGLDYIHTIIGEKTNNVPKKREYTLFDSLAQDLKTKRNKIEYYSDLISLPRIKTECDSARTQTKKDSKLEELRNRFSVSVNKYINEVNILKSNINSVVPPKNDNPNILNDLLYSLKNNNLNTVIQILNEQPELVNHVFSVSLAYEKLVKGDTFVYSV